MHFTLRLQGIFVKKLLEDGTFICSGAYKTQVNTQNSRPSSRSERMRKKFSNQKRFDCSTVVDVKLNLNCRDEIIPILRALQHIYSQPDNPPVFVPG